MGGRGGMSKIKSNTAMSGKEKDAIFTYTTSKYESINGKLRGGSGMTQSEEGIVGSMDTAIRRSKLSQDTILYRGTSPEALGIQKDIRKMNTSEVKNLVGKTLVDAAYTSTTKNKKVAQNFSGRGEHSGKVSIVIAAKKGRSALNVGSNSNFGDKEQEVILPRNAKIKITKARRERGNLTIYAEY